MEWLWVDLYESESELNSISSGNGAGVLGGVGKEDGCAGRGSV